METMPLVRKNATPRELLVACDGWYTTQRGPDGSFLTPLVGYAGRYGPDQLQYVGFDFANFAKIERWPVLVQEFVADPLGSLLVDRFGEDLEAFICPAPEGGKMLGQALAVILGMGYAHPEKVVTSPKTTTSRERTELRFSGRHDAPRDSEVILVEDVCNNFSTTTQFIDEQASHGNTVKAIACFLNRSPLHRGTFPHKGVDYPVIALWDEALPEFQQDDPAVVDAVKANSVQWKPKEDWDLLKKKAGPEAFR